MSLLNTVTALPRFLFGVKESISNAGFTTQSIINTAYDIAPTQLSSTTDIPVTTHSPQAYALAAGTATIDLQSLWTRTDPSVDAVGLKVQGLRITNLAGNAALTITGEGANGYSIGGALIVPAAGAYNVAVILWAPETLANVAAADRYLVVTGTGTQEFFLELLLG